jgi:UDP-N-acetyl-D-mannosaminuronic acid dehydrogenase
MESTNHTFTRDVCVIGGGGHVGLPLAMMFADCGLRTVVYDINAAVIERIRCGMMPFHEEGGQELLEKVLAGGKLELDSTPKLLSTCKFLVMVIGTPIDEHLNPTFAAIERAVEACASELRDGQILILRSTIYPGISLHIQRYLYELGLQIDVAFCPERIAQGHSLKEFRELPQIVSAFDPEILADVKQLFGRFSREMIEMEPMEAELCKLITNAWRYIQFAAVNQFYMIATERGLDFDRILHGCRHNYPRMSAMPGPGLTAGPCLAKDTMQLAAFSHNEFVLGHAAMLINEGLPAHLVALAKRKLGDLGRCTAGILGAAFKAESDDPRDSLSYKLFKLLKLETRRVLMSDPYVPNPDLVPMERVIDESDVIFIATPHKRYRELEIPPGKVVIDVWSCVPAQPHEAPMSLKSDAQPQLVPPRRAAN